jgi:hypothetical protein
VESRSDLFKDLPAYKTYHPQWNRAFTMPSPPARTRGSTGCLEHHSKYQISSCSPSVELTIFLPSRAPLGTDKIAFGRSAAWDLLRRAACNEAHTRDCSARDYLHGVSARCLGVIGSSAHLPTHRKAKDRWPRPLPYSRRHWDACGRRCHRRAISAPTVSDRSLPDRNRQRRRRHRYFGSIR